MIEIFLASILFTRHPETTPSVPPPPPAYDYPFPGRIYAIWMSSSEIGHYCPVYRVACLIHKTSEECYVALNREYYEHRYDILRHENGHCNDWKH